MNVAQIEHKMMMDAIGFAAQVLTTQAEAMGKLIDAERSMHSYLHITDPTLYRNAIHNKGLAQQVRLARAALAFVLEVQAVKGELMAEGAAP
jgi:hypothetical protein